MITDRISDLCVFHTLGTMPYEKQENLFSNIISVADFFGFRSLLDEFKIKIYICNKIEFQHTKEKLYKNKTKYMVAFTYGINRIFVLEYKEIHSGYSLNAYNAMIVHECIHAFQAYYSMISPREFVWLYESVACYLAKQKKYYDRKDRVSWEVFTNDFYQIDNCYGLAYNFGEEIFKHFGDEILSVIKTPKAYTAQLVEVYNSKIFA